MLCVWEVDVPCAVGPSVQSACIWGLQYFCVTEMMVWEPPHTNLLSHSKSSHRDPYPAPYPCLTPCLQPHPFPPPQYPLQAQAKAAADKTQQQQQQLASASAAPAAQPAAAGGSAPQGLATSRASAGNGKHVLCWCCLLFGLFSKCSCFCIT